MDDGPESYLSAETSDGDLSLEELEHLHWPLSSAEREELLECLLILAPQGGEAMIGMLNERLLQLAVHEMLNEQRRQTDKDGGRNGVNR
jgi:hypothetical protein